MTRFWICTRMQLWKGSEYSRIPNLSGFWICKWLINALWQGSEYAWSAFHRVLDKPLGLICQGSEYGKVVNMWGLHRVPNMHGWAWTSLNNAEYEWICQNIPEKTESWICQNYSECAWCSTSGTEQFTETLTYLEHCQTFRMEHFAKRIMPDCWCGIRNVSRQEEGGGTRALW